MLDRYLNSATIPVKSLNSKSATVADLGYTLRPVASLPPTNDRAALLALYLYATNALAAKISQKQAADLVGANLTYVVALASCAPDQRYKIACGRLTIASILAGRRRSKSAAGGDCPHLADFLKAASANARLEAAKAVGVSAIWDTMVAPILDQPINQ